MRDELSTEFEHVIIEVTAQEITELEICLRKYLEQEYRAILKNSPDDIHTVSSVVYKIGTPCHYWWYLLNYTEDIQRRQNGEPDIHTGKIGMQDGYMIEAEFNDLELLGKVIALFEEDEKLNSLLAKSDKLLYFYENFKAAQG